MKNLSILKKILIVFTFVGLTSLIIEGLLLNNIFETDIENIVDATFHENIKTKKKEIENYLELSVKRIELMSRSISVQNLFETLEKYHNKKNLKKNEKFPVNTKEYRKITEIYLEYFLDYIEINNYNDIFFICRDHGHVMFTAKHEDDFGTNLFSGKYKKSQLANLWKKVLKTEETVIIDYKFYKPSNEEAFFIGTPIYKNNELIGVFALQMSEKKLENIINKKNSIYKTSEVYVVGKSSDGKFRLKINRIIKKGKIGDEKKDKYIKKCINNKDNGNYIKIGSTGEKEYVYFYPLEIKNLNWAIFYTTSVDEVMKNVYLGRKIIIIIIVIMVLMIIVSAFFLAKSISNPIGRIVDSIEKMSNKNLDFEIYEKRGDEIGKLYKSINNVNKNFLEIITKILKISKSVSSSSKQLSFVSREVSERASEQASSTEEISSSMEEMLATINSNTKNAIETNEISKKAASKTKKTGEIFNETIKSVSDINEGILIIKDIASQINLLSLNASIEAARVGTSGRSFGVVADEIRKLAEKTNKASAKIEKLSNLGQKNSEITNENLKNLIPEIIKSAKLVNNITFASKEQSNGAEAINNSVQQLTEITNENSASAEEMSASAEDLSMQVENLKLTVSDFKIGKENVYEKERKKKIEIQEKTNYEEGENEYGFKIKLNKEKLDDEYEKF